jgi:hypothetical protein
MPIEARRRREAATSESSPPIGERTPAEFCFKRKATWAVDCRAAHNSPRGFCAACQSRYSFCGSVRRCPKLPPGVLAIYVLDRQPALFLAANSVGAQNSPPWVLRIYVREAGVFDPARSARGHRRTLLIGVMCVLGYQRADERTRAASRPAPIVSPSIAILYA